MITDNEIEKEAESHGKRVYEEEMDAHSAHSEEEGFLKGGRWMRERMKEKQFICKKCFDESLANRMPELKEGDQIVWTDESIPHYEPVYETIYQCWHNPCRDHIQQIWREDEYFYKGVRAGPGPDTRAYRKIWERK